MKELKRFTGTQLHHKPGPVYQEAVKHPVVVEHKHHGELVMMSSDKYLELTNKEGK